MSHCGCTLRYLGEPPISYPPPRRPQYVVARDASSRGPRCVVARQAVEESVREAAELRATVFALQQSHRLAAQRLGRAVGIGSPQRGEGEDGQSEEE